MYKVILNGKEVSFNPGDRVIDLVNDDDKKKWIVCEINKTIKELVYTLTPKQDGATINLLGLDNIESSKAYEGTLRYVVAMAFKRRFPDLEIKFSYNVSRAIFCEIINKKVRMSQIAHEIIEEVAEIVKQDLPIRRETISIETALKIYEEEKHYDKINILSYRPDKLVNLYHCAEYYDYMYCYMMPSTGYLANYVIKPYSPGLIIQYPRYELDAKIPVFLEEPTYGRTLKNATKWGKSTNTDTIVGINHLVEKGNTLDFIQMCETKHTNMMAELGLSILEEKENIRLICIAGPSSSGKTTFCNRLRIELMSRGINPIMISMDDYYLSKQEISKIQGCDVKDVDLEHINCLDIELFNQNLFDLINGEEVTLPKYDFQLGKRVPGRTLKVDENSPIMIEGIHALNEKLTSSIPKHQKFKVYISPQMQINIDNHSPLSTTDLRLIRRIVRDMNFRNCPAHETINMWPSVRKGEFKWIYPNQEGADYIFNSELTYELCVFKKYAIPALKKIQPGDPEYVIANRLIKYLKYFKSIDDESAIPCNSLIREFIGGSCFKV